LSLFFVHGRLNISYPKTGAQKKLEIDDEKKLRGFYEQQMSREVSGDCLGPDYKGYVFRISGGNDKQGFPMKQGVITNQRVRLLLKKGASCYRQRKRGERKRKSVRGCIVGADLSVLNLVIVKKGDTEIDGLTNKEAEPLRKGPKRASNIRKLFNLTKKDNVCSFIVRREIKAKEGKKCQESSFKAPRIQRLVTPRRLQHKRQIKALKRKRGEATKVLAKAYNEAVAKSEKEARAAKDAKRKKSSMHVAKVSTKETKKTA